MLEEPELLICPWAAEAGPPHATLRKRLIRRPATGQFLGFARVLSALSWWSWLTRKTLQVFETEDASLLMTVYRPWGLRRTWEVHDAEERRVGFIYRDGLWESSGARLAATQWTAANGGGRFVSPAGSELATFEPGQQEGMRLVFHPALEGKPFARLTVLAAVLSW
jgi:hypothetical protein